jgi:hypothetical protein
MAASSVARSPKTPERDQQAFAHQRLVKLLLERAHAVYGDIGIELVNGLAHAGEDGGGVALGARIDGHALEKSIWR